MHSTSRSARRTGCDFLIFFPQFLSSERMSSFLFFLFLPLPLPLFFIYKQSESEQEEEKKKDRMEGKVRETTPGWRMERDFLALKLFHLMVLRGIDGRKEGTQKSIKTEKGEIKSSPSHHLLKWLYSFFLSPLFSHPLLEHGQPHVMSCLPITLSHIYSQFLLAYSSTLYVFFSPLSLHQVSPSPLLTFLCLDLFPHLSHSVPLFSK